MTLVEWKDGWQTINPGYEEVQCHYPVPLLQPTKEVNNNFSGNLFTEMNSTTNYSIPVLFFQEILKISCIVYLLKKISHIAI